MTVEQEYAKQVYKFMLGLFMQSKSETKHLSSTGKAPDDGFHADGFITVFFDVRGHTSVHVIGAIPRIFYDTFKLPNSEGKNCIAHLMIHPDKATPQEPLP